MCTIGRRAIPHQAGKAIVSEWSATRKLSIWPCWAESLEAIKRDRRAGTGRRGVREILGIDRTSPFWVRSDGRNYRSGRRLGWRHGKIATERIDLRQLGRSEEHTS